MLEANLQTALVTYLSLKYKGIRYCASLGGQYQQHYSQRKKAKATGYVKGFPDLQICEARKTYHGLFIELKTKTGRITKEQQQWLDDLNERGYYAICCKGLDRAMGIIDWYLKE